MKTIISWALLLSLTLVICVSLVEYSLRAIGLGNPIIYTTNLTYRYAPLPNQAISRRRGAMVTINSSGLRATNEWDAQADLRVLFVGDSITWAGTYVDDSDIFSEKSCARLNDQLEQAFLCGNAGVNAYGTDNMAQRIHHDSINNENWLVITIIGMDATRSLADVSAGPWFLETPTFLPAIQDAMLYSLWRAIWILRRGGTHFDKDKAPLFVVENSLNQLKDILLNEAAKGKQVLVIWHPTKQEHQTGDLSAESELVVKSFRDDLYLDFIDMSTVLPRSSLDDIYYDGVHLDRQGHDIFARAISDHIASNLASRRRLTIDSR